MKRFQNLELAFMSQRDRGANVDRTRLHFYRAGPLIWPNSS